MESSCRTSRRSNSSGHSSEWRFCCMVSSYWYSLCNQGTSGWELETMESILNRWSTFHFEYSQRVAQDPFSSVAFGQLWPQWAVWLWLLPPTHLPWYAPYRVSHVAARWHHERADITAVRWGRTTAEELGPHIQWSWSLSPAHSGHGQSPPTPWNHCKELWQIWHWMLMVFTQACYEPHWSVFMSSIANRLPSEYGSKLREGYMYTP